MKFNYKGITIKFTIEEAIVFITMVALSFSLRLFLHVLWIGLIVDTIAYFGGPTQGFANDLYAIIATALVPTICQFYFKINKAHKKLSLSLLAKKDDSGDTL